MNALLALNYPVGFATVAICVIALTLVVVMAAFNKRSPQIATPVVVISIMMTLTFLVVVIYSTLRPLPESKTGELLLGALISTFTTVVVYWFGKGNAPPPPGPP